ncbi:MAG: S1/P1 nuclease [Chlamydiota bacterium]
MRKFFIFVLFLASSLFAWWDTEHMVIAKIAYMNMDENAKKKSEDLVEELAEFYPSTSTFVTASTWADEVANRGFPPGWKWHTYKRVYDPNHIVSEKTKKTILEKAGKNDAIFGIRQAIATLKNKQATRFEQAIMFRYLIHIVGDIHMPLHCGSLYNQEFPKSDFSGAKYPLLLKTEKKSLHAFWDGCLGRDVKRLKIPLTKEGEKVVEEFAKEVVVLFPKESLVEIHEMNISHWAEESFSIVENSVYVGISPNTVPTKEYIEKNRKIAFQRLALAGYRLAKLLNEIFYIPPNGE